MSRMLVSILALILLLAVGSLLAPAVTAAPGSLSPAEEAPVVLVQAQTEEDTAADSGSSLPEGLSQIFASLGLYIVTMFTMAIGTEIVVDVFKLAIGLQSKPKAKDTIAEYEKMLPGTLDSLGIGAEAQHNLRRQIDALQEVLEPALKAETVIINLQKQNFDEALAAVVTDEVKAGRIDVAKTAIKDHVNQVFDRLQTESSLGRFIFNTLHGEIDSLVDQAAEEAREAAPDTFVAKMTVVLNGRLAHTVTAWVQKEINNLQTLSHQKAYSRYVQDVEPLISSAGLSPETEAHLKRQFEDFLENLRTMQDAEVYLDSLNKLLLEVERQRDELVSTWRKWWRRLTAWVQQRFSSSPEMVATNAEQARKKMKLDPTIKSPDDAATKLLEIQRRDKQEANTRVQQLRLVSVIVGILLAYVLQIDSADLLGDLFPPDANFLTMALMTTDSAIFNWLESLFKIEMHALTAGIVLTGLAASAGSGFWHDQLSRLQAVKSGVESAYQAVQPAVVNVQRASVSDEG